MDEYSLTIAENRKVGLNIKPSTTKPKSSNREEIPHSSTLSKEKRNTSSRRQQRHSTEIGSEYYRWWAVRSSLGFQTNEHIAGLLLDGFHALLQHVVVSCGGEEYSSKNDKGSSDNKGKYDCTFPSSIKSPIPSSSSSMPQTSRAFASSFSSPPGAEEMEGFTDFNNAIVYYTNTLWCMCAQPEGGLHKMRNASPALQEFILRLIGYIRGGRGFSLNDRKRNLTKDGLFSPCTSSQANSSFNFSLMTLNPRSTDIKPPFVNISHGGSFPCYPSHPAPSLAPLMLPSSLSTIVPNSFRSNNHHSSGQYGDPKEVEHHRDRPRESVETMGRIDDIAKSLSCNTAVDTSSSKESPSNGKNVENSGKSPPGPTTEPPNFLTDEPSKSAIDMRYSNRQKPDILNDKEKWYLTKDTNTGNNSVIKSKLADNGSSRGGSVELYTFSSTEMKNISMSGKDFTSKGKNQSDHLNDSKSGHQFGGIINKETIPPRHFMFSGFSKDREIKTHSSYAPTQATPLLFFPTHSIPGTVGPIGNLPSAVQKMVYNSPMEGFPGQYPSNPGINYSNQRSQYSPYLGSDLLSSTNQLSKQRQNYLPSTSTNPSYYMPPLVSSRLSSVSSQSSVLPLFYSPSVSLPSTMQTTVASVSWTSPATSYHIACKNGVGGPSQSVFGCNQNNTMRDNFSLFRMYQDASSKTSIPGHFYSDASVSLTSSGFKMTDTLGREEYINCSSKKNSDLHSHSKGTSSSMDPSSGGNDAKSYLDNTEPKDSEVLMGYLSQDVNPLKLSRSSVAHDDDESGKIRHSTTPSKQYKIDFNKYHCGKDCTSCKSTGNSDGFETAGKLDSHPSCSRNSNGLNKRDHLKPPTNESLMNILSSQVPKEYFGDISRNSTILTSNSTATATRHNSQTANSSPSTETFETAVLSEKASNTEVVSPQATSGTYQVKRTQTTTNNLEHQTVSRVSKPSRPRRFFCTVCNVVFYSGTDLLVHRYEQHSYVCGECDGRFLSIARLQQHKATDHPQMLVCSHCRFSSFCKDTMDAHKRSKHHSVEEECQNRDAADKEKRHLDRSGVIGDSPFPQDEAANTKSKVDVDKDENYSLCPSNIATDQSQESSFNDNKCEIKGLFLSKTISDPQQSTDNMPNAKKEVCGSLEKVKRVTSQKSCFEVGAPCPGSVFPSFSRTTPHHMTSSKVDNIISMFSQVNDYCRFDPLRFLPPVSEECNNETECKESVLVIDTDTDGTGGKESSTEPPQACYVNKDMRNETGGSNSTGHPNTHDFLIDTVPENPAENSNKMHIEKRSLPGKSKKKKRKAPGLKNSNKKLKTKECDECTTISKQFDVNNTTKLIETNEGVTQSDVQINEKKAHNSTIKTHRVWLDDFQDTGQLIVDQKDQGKDITENWATLQPIDSGRQNSQWNSPKYHKSYEDCSSELCDIPSHEKQSFQEKDDTLNARILSLRERHRSHYLPPKKRGIRKTFKVHGDVKINEIENSTELDNSPQNLATYPPK